VFYCPQCGSGVEPWLEDHDQYTCPQCDARYMAMVDPETNEAAFFHRNAPADVEPLGWPKGSIRAVIALAMAGVSWYMLYVGWAVPGSLLSLLLTVIGFYFGFRTKAAGLSDRVYDPAARREQPLHLPAGWIRMVLVIGFAVAAVTVHRQGRLGELPYLEFFFILGGLVVGHFAGRMIRSAPEASRQALANAKGLLGLVMAAVLTGLFATGYHTALPAWVVTLLCATITFYFGSRG
jgi:TRAP-type C4-dicarboxylate transport system permease large subunit